ncbi:hypothetical protein N7462_001697 [Penicillium macrosclerotiorum]|uniref:uncharacterized protein n=1 Tax=Penicillium macrosclerotiorum TaxID=303699 RepID=UPI00254867E9|nr:uncharacterized protein N7462_001697 [Penicillium macrosclerotiorum]KAJ5692274.1 hypothetical protein N7462_001697 [Penicillium macrosclerotiorum]
MKIKRSICAIPLSQISGLARRLTSLSTIDASYSPAFRSHCPGTCFDWETNRVIWRVEAVVKNGALHKTCHDFDHLDL